MTMKSMVAAESPAAYVKALTGWRKSLVTALRRSTLDAATLEERIKWGNIVYFSNGPVCMVRAEDARVLFGFWRGQRLREIEPRLKGGGRYEMATLVLEEGDTLGPAVARRLVREAVKLNKSLGDPTAAASARGTSTGSVPTGRSDP